MDKKTGRAILKGNKLCFNEVGWNLVKAVAKRKKRTPRQVVLAALRRGIKVGLL